MKVGDLVIYSKVGLRMIEPQEPPFPNRAMLVLEMSAPPTLPSHKGAAPTIRVLLHNGLLRRVHQYRVEVISESR